MTAAATKLWLIWAVECTLLRAWLSAEADGWGSLYALMTSNVACGFNYERALVLGCNLLVPLHALVWQTGPSDANLLKELLCTVDIVWS